MPAEDTMDPWITINDIAKASKNPIYVEGPILGSECSEQIAQGRAILST